MRIRLIRAAACAPIRCIPIILTLACVGTAGCRAIDAPEFRFLRQVPAVMGLSGTNARAEAWQQWGEQNLESGDLLFVHGESRILLGLVNFSRLASDLADSPFSHIALVSREQDRVWVYDIVAEGPRRIAFSDFVADRRLSLLAVKRLRPEYRQHIPRAIEFCRQVWQQQTPFDEDFRSDNGRWYCSELIETAFRQAGLALSEPVPIQQLPGYTRITPAVRQLVLTARSIDPAEPVFLPGNDAMGIWSSPTLQLVLEPTDIDAPPSHFRAIPPESCFALSGLARSDCCLPGATFAGAPASLCPGLACSAPLGQRTALRARRG